MGVVEVEEVVEVVEVVEEALIPRIRLRHTRGRGNRQPDIGWIWKSGPKSCVCLFDQFAFTNVILLSCDISIPLAIDGTWLWDGQVPNLRVHPTSIYPHS